MLKEGLLEEVTVQLSLKAKEEAKVWSQNVPEGRTSKGKVPTVDMTLTCLGRKRSVCAGGERSPPGGRSKWSGDR